VRYGQQLGFGSAVAIQSMAGFDRFRVSVSRSSGTSGCKDIDEERGYTLITVTEPDRLPGLVVLSQRLLVTSNGGSWMRGEWAEPSRPGAQGNDV
jgi:hypothetical protein